MAHGAPRVAGGLSSAAVAAEAAALGSGGGWDSRELTRATALRARLRRSSTARARKMSGMEMPKPIPTGFC
jgi:hypothetical protein